MNFHPILFSGPMVRAILEGKKSQTRRVIKPQPTIERRDIGGGCSEVIWQDTKRLINVGGGGDPMTELIERLCPYYRQPGDRLWVRETLRRVQDSEGTKPLALYDCDRLPVYKNNEFADWVWERNGLPSIHMPRWASRITLEVLAVRVERLTDISEAAICAEMGAPGPEVEGPYPRDYYGAFSALWDSINGKRGFGWNANPWVWVVEFKQVQP